MRGKRRRTVYAFESYYGAGNSSATDSIRAVSDTVAEIDVGAETGWIWGGTSESGVWASMSLKQIWPQEGREEIAVIVELVVVEDEEDGLVVIVVDEDFELLVVVVDDEDLVVEDAVVEEREPQLPN